MASMEVLCGPCTKRGVSNSVILFCTDCDKPLCQFCTDLHSSPDVLATHHLVDLDVSSRQGFKVKKNCNTQNEMSYEFFCTFHDCLCGRSCLASDHKSCNEVLPIEVAAKNVTKSELFEEITIDIGNIENTFRNILEHKTCKKVKLSERKSAIKNEIAILKQRVLKRISELEAKLNSEVDDIFEELGKQVTVDIQVLSDEIQKIDDFKSQCSLLKEHGSEIQVFAFLHTIKIKFSETGNCL